MILLFRDDTVGTIYLLIHDMMHYEGENKNIVNKRDRERGYQCHDLTRRGLSEEKERKWATMKRRQEKPVTGRYRFESCSSLG